MCLHLSWNAQESRKMVQPPSGWNKMSDEALAATHAGSGNGYALLCGRGENPIIVIDVDKRKADAAGVTLDSTFMALCKQSTLFEITPNGQHYYFTLSEGQTLMQSQTNMKWRGETMQYIDLLAADKFCICAPSKYMAAGKSQEYKIMRGSLDALTPLPEELYAGLIEKPAVVEDPTVEVGVTDEMLELYVRSLDILPAKPCATDYDIWKRIGLWIKSMLPDEAGFKMWQDFSAKAENYSADACLKFWRSCRPNGSIKYGSILFYIKKHCSADEYDAICALRDVLMGDKYELHAAMFEEANFYCKETQDICGINADGTLTHFSLQNAKYTFAEYNYDVAVTVKGKSFNRQELFIPKWLNSSEKKIVRKIVSTPLATPPDCYNLFRGFVGARAQGENLTGLERFKYLCSLLGSKNGDYTRYIFQWFAKLVQRPADIPRCCMIFIGEEGVGKDTVIDFLGRKIIGDAMYSIITDADNQLYDSHSNTMMNTFLHKLEEASATSNRAHADKLKSLITQQTQMINEKNVKKFSMDTYPHFVMTTNNQSPVKLSDTDRRFFITWVASDRRGDSDFWTETYALFDDERTVASVWKFLNEFDLSGMPAIRPETEYFRALQKEDADSVAEWIKAAELNDTGATEAYQLYKQWGEDKHIAYIKNIIAFGKTMATLVEKEKIDRRMKNGYNLYSSK